MDAPVVLLSIDLDPVPCYHAIHGLRRPQTQPDTLCSTKLSPDFSSFSPNTGCARPFCIGADLHSDPLGAAKLKEAARGGHELANHSQNHPYALTRLSAEEIRNEILRGHETILASTGQAPGGLSGSRLYDQRDSP